MLKVILVGKTIVREIKKYDVKLELDKPTSKLILTIQKKKKKI